MSTETLTLKIPTTLAQELSTASQAFLVNILERGLQEFQMERALEQYRRGGISFGAAAQKAKVPQSVLARYAYSKGVEPAFSTKTVDEELGDMPC